MNRFNKETNCCINKIPSNKELNKNYEILKSLADPTRLKILYLLKEGELCACKIIESIDKSQSTVSHHLNILRKEGILEGRKEGTWIHYKLSDEKIIEYINKIFELIEE